MKAEMNIKSIMILTLIIFLASMLFINISFAANTGVITVETAKLREGPSTDSTVLELVSEGEKVEILEEADGWYKVKYSDVTGYIRKDLMKRTENAVVEFANELENNTIQENQITEIKEEVSVNNESNNETDKKLELGNNKTLREASIKMLPLINSMEVEQIKAETEVEVKELLNGWAKIKTSNEKEGWVRVETFNEPEITTPAQPQQEAKTMYINSQTVNIRQQPDKSSDLVTQLSLNTAVTVLSTENSWCYIDINGTKGYVSESLLSNTKKAQETSRSATTQRAAAPVAVDSGTSTASGNAVVEEAKKYLGCSYVYGGSTPAGFDCSGFTQYVYRQLGVSLNRTAASQYSNGTAVTSLQPGDLVMFGKGGIGHVGIYIGGNQFIHAANKSQGVRIDSLSTGYYNTNYVGARRIF